MTMKMGSHPLWRVGCGVLALSLTFVSAYADGALNGQAEGSGKAGARSTRGTVSIKDGKVYYTFKYAAQSYRRVPEVTLSGTLAGTTVTFAVAEQIGIAERVGEVAGGTVTAGDSTTFTGKLEVKNGKLTMSAKGSKSVKLQGYKVKSFSMSGPWVANETAEEGETGTGTPSDGTGTPGSGNGENGGVTAGSSDNSTEPATPAEPVRLKIGHAGVDLKPNQKYEVIVPLAGELNLMVGAGTVSVTRPDGEVVEGNAVKVSDKQLGKYTIAVKDGSGTIKANYTQDGRIDSRIRPWSSHTWYPVNHYSSGTSENDATMFHKGGPMEKFDQALGLSGTNSAKDWEMNGYGNRTSLAFENGHYARISRPEEKNWIVDCNLNGVRRYESDAEFLKTVDTNNDGSISRDELVKDARKTALLLFWKGYETNGDGFITADEISASFVKKYDSDNDSKLTEAEWNAALEKDYVENLDRSGEQEVTRTFAERDRDGDGKLSAAEASPANGRDVIDSADEDGDGRDFMDTDNTVLVMKDGKLKVGNKMEKADGKIKLYKGYKKDELVGEFAEADVTKILEGVADGKYTGSYSVGWWGHCNAWAMAAIMFQVPKADIQHNGVTFSVRDQKALLVALAMRDTTDSSFWWQQWGNKDEMPDKKYASAFHNQLKKWLRDEQQGVMADMDLKPIRQTTGFQVWNYPLLGYVANVKEAEGDDPYVLEMDVSVQKGSYSDEDSESSAKITYTLHFTESGSIRDDDDSKTDWTTRDGWGDSAPKAYIRYLIHPFEFSGTLSSANPRVTLEQVETVFGGKLKRNSLESLRAEEARAGAAAPSGN